MSATKITKQLPRESKKMPCRMWRPEQLPANFAGLLVSARRAGKTTLLKSLCIQEPGAWLKKFEEGYIVVFCGSAHTAQEYSQFVPGKYVHQGLREDIIQSWWEHCDACREKGSEPPACLMIFDDLLVTTSNKKYKVTRTSNNYWLGRIWQEGRHQNISCILSVQSLAVALPFVRCSDFFICFPSAFYSGQDHKMLTENYMPCQSKKTAEWISDHFTQHEALVCEYWRQSSRKWETRIFWYKVSKAIATYDGLSGVREGPKAREHNDAAAAHQHVHAPLHKGKSQKGDTVPENRGRDGASDLHDSGHGRRVDSKEGQTILEGE